MKVEQHINTYLKGLDKETSVTKYSNEHYYHAEELRLITHDTLLSGSLNSVKGNEIHFKLPEQGGTQGKIHGHGFIRDNLVLFTRHAAGDRIYFIDLTENFTESDHTIKDYSPNTYLRFEGDLNFHEDYPITKVIGRYETKDVLKVYWTDAYNNIRFANLGDDLEGYEIDKFDFTPDVEFGNIDINNIGFGNLKSGVVQYAYQFYNLRGSESMFSPASKMIDLSPDSLSLSDTRLFKGGDAGENSGKSVSMSISISEDNKDRFDRIRIIRIMHEDLNVLPIIDVVSEQVVSSNVVFTDTGSVTLETIPLEFVREIKNLVTCKDLDTKNNFLFAVGLKEDYFDFDFDARAYRFSEGTSYTISNMSTVGNSDIKFSNPVVYKTTPDSEIPLNPTLDDLWYIENDVIYFLAPLKPGENSNFSAHSTTGVSDLHNIEDVFSFDGTYITFGDRNIHSTGDIATTESGIAFPEGWPPEDAVQAQVKGNPETKIITSSTISNHPDDWGVNNNHDAINSFNSIGEVHDPEYKFQSDGITLGGEGPNIEYTFDTKEILIDDSQDDRYFYTGTESDNPDNPSYTNYASPYIKSLYVGYQRDEIYSFGIVGFDVKGRQSFVKWIGDIRFPKSTDTGYEIVTEDGDGNIFAKILYIKFKVSNLPEDVVSYQIVRCERTRNDRTVIDTGLMGSMGSHEGGEENHIRDRFKQEFNNEVIVEGSSCNRAFEYMSPEVNFNKSSVILTTDSIEITEWATRTASTPIFHSDHGEDRNYLRINKIKDYTVSDHAGVYYSLDDIKLFETSFNTEDHVMLDGVRVKNQIIDPYGDGDDSNYKGTTLILRTSDGITGLGTERDETNVFKVARRRHIIPYGGNTYNARLNRTYIACTPIYSREHVAEIDCFEGDTYINFFDYHRILWNGERPATNPFANVVYFPVESSINLSLRLDNHMNKEYDGQTDAHIDNDDVEYVAMKESAGVFYVGYEKYYTQSRDLYQYNSVYSKPNNTKEFIPMPFDFGKLTTQEFDCRFIVSDKKTNGEMIDSWTNLRFGRTIEVDTQHGPVEALINYNNTLLYFQSGAIGVLSVEERELTESTTAGTLTLGIGGIMDRYDYISTKDGCSDKLSIIKTKMGLYFYDRNNNTLNRLGESVEEISKMAGMQPFFKETITDASIPVIGALDRLNNEVLLTYPHPEKGFTLSFNIMLDVFTSFYKFVPTYYIQKDLDLMSSEDASDVFLHNKGQISVYYDNAPEDAKLTIIVNPGSSVMCRYDVLNFFMDVIDENNETLQKTFTHLRAYNSYQDTGYIELDGKIKRRMRTWRYNRLRDRKEGVKNSPSLKDTYMILELIFSNNGTDRVRIDDIVTMFVPTKIH